MKKILFSFIFTILAFGFSAGVVQAAGCAIISGDVESRCSRSSPGSDWVRYDMTDGSCDASFDTCWVKKGDELCKVIRITYSCNAPADCNSIDAMKDNCAGGKVCCLSKRDPSEATTGIPAVKPMTTDMVKHESPLGALKNPFAGKTVPTLIGSLIKGIGGLAGSLFFLYLLWGGVEWMTARGVKRKTENARNRIVHAVLGILIVIGSYIAVSAIIGFTTTF